MSYQTKTIFSTLSLLVSLLMLAGTNRSQADDPIEPDRATMEAFVRAPGKGPVYMLNLLKFKPDGGKEAYGRYSLVALAHVIRRGGQVAFIGKAQPIEDPPAPWDVIAIVKYPSRQAFMDMVTDPTYQLALPNRRKGLERTVLYPFVARDSAPPVAAGSDAPDRRPPADGSKDQALVILSLVKIAANDRAKAATQYAAAAHELIQKHGGEILLDLSAESPLVSDKTWDHLLLFKYRSRRSFLDAQKAPDYRTALAGRENTVERTLSYAFTPGQ